MERSLWVSVSAILVTMYTSQIGGETFFSRVAAWCGSSQVDPRDKALDGGKIETITFYVPQSPGDNHFIARKGVLLRRPNARGVIVICHGYSCDKFDAAFLRMMFPRYHVVTFDFRAHGEHVDAQHQCTFGKNEAYEVIAAAQFVKNDPELNRLPCIAFGFSMGAVAAIQAQAADPTLFAAMVLDCPYDDSQNIVKRGLENLKITVGDYTFDLPGKTFLERHAFNPYVQGCLKWMFRLGARMDATMTNTQLVPLSPRDLIKQVTVPCFFIHCAHDDKISVQAIQNVYANAGGFKRLWVTDGRRHFDSFFYNPEQYCYEVNRFISMILDGSYKQEEPAKKIFDVKEDNQQTNDV